MVASQSAFLSAVHAILPRQLTKANQSSWEGGLQMPGFVSGRQYSMWAFAAALAVMFVAYSLFIPQEVR